MNFKLVIIMIFLAGIVSISPIINYSVAYNYNQGFKETIN